jgi:hypothetical protein
VIWLSWLRGSGVGKAGLALDLSDRDTMRDEPMQIGERTWHIWEWEDQFWRNEPKPLRPGGDPVYRAPVDTTFALYDKTFFNPKKPTRASYDETTEAST